MEHFSRECLEIDQQGSQQTNNHGPAPMDKVYDRAAKLVKRTLDVEEVLVMDVSHCEVLETLNTEATVSVVMHHGSSQIQASSRILTAEEQSKLNAFFDAYPDGKISEGILPVCFRPFIPTHIQYALSKWIWICHSGFLIDTPKAVPVFNIDKRPFALICAYNASDPSRRFVSHAGELGLLCLPSVSSKDMNYPISVLLVSVTHSCRDHPSITFIGVIILSAVLKRRMMLADQAKSLFISKYVLTFFILF